MTIVLDPDTERLHALFWEESDGFRELRTREIQRAEAVDYCAHGDYVKIQRLSEAMEEITSNRERGRG